MISEFDHPEHCWKWTPIEVKFLNEKFSEKDALLRQALEALQYLDVTAEHKVDGRIAEVAITAIKNHLGEA